MLLARSSSATPTLKGSAASRAQLPRCPEAPAPLPHSSSRAIPSPRVSPRSKATSTTSKWFKPPGFRHSHQFVLQSQIEAVLITVLHCGSRSLGCRLTVGRLTLDQVVGVRIPAPQPKLHNDGFIEGHRGHVSVLV